MSTKLSEAQRRFLAKVPDEMTMVQYWRRFRSVLFNPTLQVLRERGLVKILYRPPRWQRTPAGRAALEAETKGE